MVGQGGAKLGCRGVEGCFVDNWRQALSLKRSSCLFSVSGNIMKKMKYDRKSTDE